MPTPQQPSVPAEYVGDYPVPATWDNSDDLDRAMCRDLSSMTRDDLRFESSALREALADYDGARHRVFVFDGLLPGSEFDRWARRRIGAIERLLAA